MTNQDLQERHDKHLNNLLKAKAEITRLKAEISKLRKEASCYSTLNEETMTCKPKSDYWNCKNCGILSPEEVCYNETCDHCGADVRWIERIREAKNK